MSDLSASLELDVTDAMSSIDQVEAALGTAGENGGANIASALADGIELGVSNGVDAAQSALDDIQAPTLDVGVAVDDSELQGVADSISSASGTITVDTDTAAVDDALGHIDDLTAAVDAAEVVTVDADTSAIDDAAAQIDELAATAEATAPLVVVDADTSGVEDAVAQVDELIAAEAEATDTITVDADTSTVGDASAQMDAMAGSTQAAQSGAEGLGTELLGLGAIAGVANGDLEGTAGIIKGLPGGFGLAAVSGAAFGAAFGKIMETTLQADEAQRRFDRTLGDSAAKVEDLSGTVPGLDGSIAELAISTGSSVAGLRNWAATFGGAARAAGQTADQADATSKQIIVLANSIAASNPKLGTADEVIGRLGSALARGGRFAANFGLGFLQAGDITAKASEMFNKPAASLSFIEKQAAGAQLAMERLGPTMAESIEKGTKDPIVQLRSLERELAKVLITGTKPLIGPFVESLKSLAPILEGAASVFTGLASGILPVFAGELIGIGKVLGVVADLMDNRFVQAALTGAGAYLAVTRSASLFLNVLERVGPAVASLGARFVEMVSGVQGQFAALQAASIAQGEYEAATIANADAQLTLAFALDGTSASTAEAAAVGEAYTLVQDAQAAAAAANAEALAAAMQVEEAQAAVEADAILSKEGLTAAMEAEVAASAAAAAALDDLAAAQALLAETSATAALSVDPLTAGLGVLGGEAAAASVEMTGMEGAMVGMEGAGLGLTALLGPLGIVAAVAAGAFALFSSGSKESERATKDATKSLEDYRKQIGLTNTQLASLSTADAAKQFQQADEAGKRFFDTLDQGSKEAFNKAGLNIADVGAALDGNTKAAQRFRAALVSSGEVRFVGGDAKQATKDFIALGDATKQAARNASQVGGSDISAKFKEQSEAAKAATDALLAEARAEIKSGDASNTSALQTLAATGGLGNLSDKAEAAGRALLAKADAAQAAANVDIAAAVAGDQHNTALETQIEAVGRLQAAQAAGGTADTGDLGAARALAASSSYDTLDDATKKAVDSVLKAADAQRNAAGAAGHLVDANGEVTKSYTDLVSEMDKAITKFDELSGRQGNQDAAGRTMRASFDGIAKAVKDSGTNTDDLSAKTADAAEKARTLADNLHGAAGNIRTFAEDGLKNGTIKAEDFTKTLGLLGGHFVDLATKAGIPKDQIEKIAAAEGLLPDQISQNFVASGLSESATNVEALQAGIETLNAQPTTKVKIDVNADAKTQFEQISAAINALPPDKRVEFLTTLDAASAAATHSGLQNVETNDGLGYNPEMHVNDGGSTAKTKAEIDAVAAAKYEAAMHVTDSGTADATGEHVAQVAARNYQSKIIVGADMGPFNAAVRQAQATAYTTLRSILIQGFSASNPPAKGPGESEGGIFRDGVRTFAAGGATDVNEALIRRKLENRSTQTGFYPAGSYAMSGDNLFGEKGTAGEYFISRDETVRPRNVKIVATAAKDFGYDLVPAGQQKMPPVMVNVQGGGATDVTPVVDALGSVRSVLERFVERAGNQKGDVIVIPQAEARSALAELDEVINGW